MLLQRLEQILPSILYGVIRSQRRCLGVESTGCTLVEALAKIGQGCHKATASNQPPPTALLVSITSLNHSLRFKPGSYSVTRTARFSPRNTMPNNNSPRGPAPKGFWEQDDKKAESILMSIVLASLEDTALSTIDWSRIARAVGEGKLGKKSCRFVALTLPRSQLTMTRAKVSQLVSKGRQRIDDSDTRARAGNEAALPDMLDLANSDTGDTASGRNLVTAAEVFGWSSKAIDRKRKAGAPERRTKKKKHSREQRSSTAVRETGASVSRADRDPNNRFTTAELDAALDHLVPESSPPRAERRDSASGKTKRESLRRPANPGDPALEGKGQSKESPIVLDELEDEEDHSGEEGRRSGQAASKSGRASSSAGKPRAPLQSIINGTSIQKRSMKTADKTGKTERMTRLYGPSGKIHVQPVIYRTRAWQPPYLREFSIART
jgi:hypothetical protein